jgi:hypothetical protein
VVVQLLVFLRRPQPLAELGQLPAARQPPHWFSSDEATHVDGWLELRSIN